MNGLMIYDYAMLGSREIIKIKGLGAKKCEHFKSQNPRWVNFRPASIGDLRDELCKMGIIINCQSSLLTVAKKFKFELTSLKNGNLAYDYTFGFGFCFIVKNQI